MQANSGYSDSGRAPTVRPLLLLLEVARAMAAHAAVAAVVLLDGLKGWQLLRGHHPMRLGPRTNMGMASSLLPPAAAAATCRTVQARK